MQINHIIVRKGLMILSCIGLLLVLAGQSISAQITPTKSIGEPERASTAPNPLRNVYRKVKAVCRYSFS